MNSANQAYFNTCILKLSSVLLVTFDFNKFEYFNNFDYLQSANACDWFFVFHTLYSLIAPATYVVWPSQGCK